MSKTKNSLLSLLEDTTNYAKTEGEIKESSLKSRSRLQTEQGFYKNNVLMTNFGAWDESLYKDHPNTLSMAEVTGELYKNGHKALIQEGRKELGEFFERTEGQSLKGLRLMRGMSQTELAEAAGVRQYNISRYESGRDYPNMNTSTKLCQVLDISPDTLFSVMGQEWQK